MGRPAIGRAKRLVVVVALLALTTCAKSERRYLTVFAAASMATTLDALRVPFAEAHPGWEVRTEISGSRIACRKLIDEGRAADLVIVADRELIDTLLIPKYAAFAESFAANALVIAWARGSRVDALLGGDTPWQTTLARDDIRVGIGDPQQAPVGYRALMALQLNDASAPEDLRVGQVIASRITDRDRRDDVAKLALAVETGSLDVAFVYASDAEQRHLAFRRLDPKIDFSDPARAEWYATAKYTIAGQVIRGSPATYAMTIPRNAEHPAMAVELVKLLVSPQGQALAGRAHIIPFDKPEVSGEPPTALR